MQPETPVTDETPTTEPEADSAVEPAPVEPSPILDPAFDHRAMAKRLMALAGLILPEKELTEMAAKPDEVDEDERCILAGCRPGGVVLDPFAGSGTTGMVALRHGRRFTGIDLSATYLDLALRTRLAQTALVDEIGVA